MLTPCRKLRFGSVSRKLASTTPTTSKSTRNFATMTSRRTSKTKKPCSPRLLPCLPTKIFIAAYRRLRDLHNKWRRIGPVAKELREDIWGRFREASTEINKRYRAFFEARKAREAENEAAKTELCRENRGYRPHHPQDFCCLGRNHSLNRSTTGRLAQIGLRI